MKTVLNFVKSAFGLAALAAFVLVLVGLFGPLSQRVPVGQQAYPIGTVTPTAPPLPATPTPQPYPPPATPVPTEVPTVTPAPPTPTVPVSAPETPPVPGKAASLWNGDIWLVEQGHDPRAITRVGDVSAIFGWNWDGTKLLFGRGRKQHEWEFISDTTELWVIELASGAMRQLTTGSNVHTAVWSPVEDHLAYCDQEAGLKVISAAGELLYEIPNGECIRSTWSPDGTRLATGTYSKEEDRRPYEELENVKLVIVNFSDDTITVLTDKGIPYAPVWSMDGKYILFQLALANQPFGQSLWHLADVVTGSVTRLDKAPPFAAVDPIRSPRGDFIVVGVGEEFHVLDFAGNTLFTARGRGPVWAPDGHTIVYRDEAGQLQAVSLPLEVRSSKIGGDLPAPVLFDYLSWKFFFAP